MTSRPSSDFVPATHRHGLLLLDKDRGLSSNAALQRVKRLLGIRKAGHTGSLDPLATGLLPICVGEATKLAGFMLDIDKRYSVVVRLGIKTDTGDGEGEVLARHPVPVLDAQGIESVLNGFRGPIVQIPPMYSALKHQGRRLYDLARRGIQVDRPGRQVEIFALSLGRLDGDRLSLDVHCSKGTYIRTLAEDLGEALGCGAHVESLRRTAVGTLSLSHAYTLEQIERLDGLGRLGLIQATERLVPTLPVLEVDDHNCNKLRHGQRVRVPGDAAAGLVGLRCQEAGFFGIGEVCSAGWIAPRRLFQTPENHAGRATER